MNLVYTYITALVLSVVVSYLGVYLFYYTVSACFMLGIMYCDRDTMMNKTWSQILNSSESEGGRNVNKKFELRDVFQVKVYKKCFVISNKRTFSHCLRRLKRISAIELLLSCVLKMLKLIRKKRKLRVRNLEKKMSLVKAQKEGIVYMGKCSFLKAKSSIWGIMAKFRTENSLMLSYEDICMFS